MSRRLRLVLVAVGVVALLVGATVLALPEIIRRVAVSQLTTLTGRAVRIERVELNPFTGRFGISRLGIARRPGHGPEAFVEFDRLDGRVGLGALFGFDVRLVQLELRRPAVRITRTGPADFDFSDLLQLFVAPVGKQEPSRFTFSLGRLEVTDGTVIVDDAFLSPPVQWRVEGLEVRAAGLTTRPAQPPGSLSVKARLGDAALDVSSRSVSLSPAQVTLDVALRGFDVTRVRPYLPPGSPALPESGVLTVALTLDRVRAGEALGESSLSGDVTLERLAVVQPAQAAPFLRADRLAVAIERMDFLARDVKLGAIELDGLAVKASRDAQGRIDLAALARPERAPDTATPAPASPASPPTSADATPPAAPRGPPAAPSLPTVRVARVSVRSASAVLDDAAVSPARQWRLDGLAVDATGLTTAPGDGPAKVSIRGHVIAGGATARPASVAIDGEIARLSPPAATARVTLGDFALAAIRPYWPESLPASVPEGSVAVALDVAAEQDAAGALSRAVAPGTARLEGLALVARGQPAPFARIPRLTVGLTQADLSARRIALGAVEVDGARVRVVRGPDGQIDVLGLATAAAPAAQAVVARTGLRTEAAAPVAPPPPAPAWKFSLDRFAFGRGTLTFEDADVSPPATLTLDDVALDLKKVVWPLTAPATFALSLGMPGGGRTDGKGTVVLEPLNVQISLSTRTTPIEPYRSYFPFAAELSGLFSGDSVSEIQRGPKGELILASRGTAWASNLAVRAPGAAAPVASLDAMVIRDIDFSWPAYALVDRVVLTRPRVLVERAADGVINLRALFEPKATGRDAPAAAGAPPAAPAATPSAGSAPPPIVGAPSVGSAPVPTAAAPSTESAPVRTAGTSSSAEPAPAPPATPVATATGSAAAAGAARVEDRVSATGDAGNKPGTAAGRGDGGGPAAPASQDGGRDASPPAGPMQTMVIDFNQIDVEDGFGRFVDHTTQPTFAEDISRLALTIKGLSNVMGRAERTTVSAQALVGADGALDLRGDLSGLGEALKADLVVELRDFTLASANPYADALTSWTVQRGTLQAKIHYRVEGDRITAEHDLMFKKLAVAKSAAPADAAARRIGVPLGLAVALLKDKNGDIDFSLPLSGTLSDQNFNWGELIWAGVKQVIVKVLLSPFSAIGRLLKGDGADKLEVDPVTFAPGSAVIAPSTEAQLTRLAEFLRRSPNIKLTLAAVVSAEDLASLKEQAVSARVEALREAEKLSDTAAALKAYYEQHLPEVAMPATVGQQLALLAEREPEPTERIADLVARRLEATRADLVKSRGIAEARVAAPPAAPPVAAAAGQGRVEFAIAPVDG